MDNMTLCFQNNLNKLFFRVLAWQSFKTILDPVVNQLGQLQDFIEPVLLNKDLDSIPFTDHFPLYNIVYNSVLAVYVRKDFDLIFLDLVVEFVSL